jgi:hypothetical protein
MTWEDIRKKMPNEWVLVEALHAQTINGLRIIAEYTIVATFGDNSQQALQRYGLAQQAQDGREYYMMHTARERYDIAVLDQFGRSLIPSEQHDTP